MLDPRGIFLISIDFELYWGVRDKKTLEAYWRNLEGARPVIAATLDLFRTYEIHATWATVGFLFFDTREELLAALPERRPAYADARLDPYQYLGAIGAGEGADPFHFGASEVRRIAAQPHQEIGSHTFSHYYCLERGQDGATFRADLEAAIGAGKRLGVAIESLVLPRNQFNEAYGPICAELGIKAYRGTPAAWIFQPRSEEATSRAIRAMRLADAYVNLTGHGCYRPEAIARVAPLNIPASRYLRGHAPRLAALEPLRLRRITRSMTHAARHGLAYHLWWHPHSLGAHRERNMAFLRDILEHHRRLRETRGMESLNMREFAGRLLREAPRER